MKCAPRLLVDVRETADLRGFHAIAVLHLLAERLREVEIYRLGGEKPDERIACDAFAFDTALRLHACRLPIDIEQPFDLYLSAANTLPWDETSVAARRAARRTVAALMFGLREFQPAFAGIVVSGHDTPMVAEAVLSELRSAATDKPA
jgi:hypothetical protein